MQEPTFNISGQGGPTDGGETAAGARGPEGSPPHADMLRGWRFLTSHARVLLAVALDAAATIDEIAESVMLSRRSTFRVLADLQKAGYVLRARAGRKNRYEINRMQPLADPLVENEPAWKLVASFAPRHVDGRRLEGRARRCAGGAAVGTGAGADTVHTAGAGVVSRCLPGQTQETVGRGRLRCHERP